MKFKSHYYNWLLLILILLGVLSTIIGILVTSLSANEKIVEVGWLLYENGLFAANLFGIVLLFKNGTLIKSNLFKVVKSVLVLIILGVIFKILHLTMADILISIGLSAMTIVYILSFLKKRNKIRLDYLKLAWIVTANTFGVLILTQILGGFYARIPNYILWLAIIDFVIAGLRNKTLLRKAQ